MSSLWKSLLGVFEVNPPVKTAIEDPTIYQVKTSIGNYCGKIVYQDDVMMMLKIAKPKAIKILKSNIERITMVQTELAKEYYLNHSSSRHGA